MDLIALRMMWQHDAPSAPAWCRGGDGLETTNVIERPVGEGYGLVLM